MTLLFEIVPVDFIDGSLIVGIFTLLAVAIKMFVDRRINSEIGDLEDNVEEISDSTERMERDLYGSSKDDTRDGLLVETRQGFDHLEDRLDDMERARKHEHQEVERRLRYITRKLNDGSEDAEGLDQELDDELD